MGLLPGDWTADSKTSKQFVASHVEDQEGVSYEDYTEAVSHRREKDPDSEENLSILRPALWLDDDCQTRKWAMDLFQ